MPRSHRYTVGIDLGTTNCAIAYVERRRRGAAQVRSMPVVQRVSETQVAERRTLPSFMYLPGEHELPDEALTLPWSENVGALVGEFARVQGTRIPSRLVGSAKSWLCHPRADRTAPILPWDAPASVSRVSPLEASARYLVHLREAWDDRFGKGARLQDQEIVLTVPASFNEVARELTVQAARMAGLEKVTLLEEPQAAFYAWLHGHSASWTSSLQTSSAVLVCDIGGGTTDFTLIRVDPPEEKQGPPVLRRVAVGEHLMLGGDNMDLALAHVMEQALGQRYDARSWGVLLHECRIAKEHLLSPDARESWTVTIPGGGSRLVGGMTSAPLLREDVEQLLLEGFFPFTAYDEAPTRARRSGLAEWGLPYAADPAVSRHLAQFLRLQGNLHDPRSLPDAVLFNGAALQPALLRRRVLELIGHWSGRVPRELPSHDLDLAVAQGAAWYGRLRETGGTRIQGGTARAYYVGVAAEAASGQGDGRPSSAGQPTFEERLPQSVCLIPRGLEEGETVEIVQPEFRVLVDRPVAFPLFASSVRQGDQPGDLVVPATGEMYTLPPLVTVLGTRRRSPRGPKPLQPADDEAEAARPEGAETVEAAEASEDVQASGLREEATAPEPEEEPDADAAPDEIPVRLRARVTEVGTLDLWCVARDSGQKWRLQFQVRGGGEDAGPAASSAVTHASSEDPEVVRAAIKMVVSTFRTRPSRLEAADLKPRGLMWALEETLHKRRDDWSLGLLREVWEALDRVKARRRSGEQYEAPWLNATGFCLRPGFGYPLDDWRVNRTWDIFPSGLQYPRHSLGRLEWWVLWRRLAGGLGRERQQELFAELAPHLLPGRKHLKTRLGAPGTHVELTEVLRLVASLERLDPAQKLALGEMALRRLGKRAGTLETWMLARLGARVLLASSPHTRVDADVAERWMLELVRLPWKDARMAGFAVCQIGRLTGDRVGELPEDARRQAFARLQQEGLTELALPLVGLVEMKADEEAAVAGETLPVGLRLGAAR